MDQLIEWAKGHAREIIPLLVIVFWVAGPILQARSRKKRADPSRPGPGPRTGPRTGPSDLEQKVRRNFEELLRRTGQKGTSASAPSPRPPVPVAPTAGAASRPVERVPMPAPVLDELDELEAAPHHAPKPTPHATHHPPHAASSHRATHEGAWAAPATPAGAPDGPDPRVPRARLPDASISFTSRMHALEFDGRRLLLRHGALDRAELRRAFLLKVILDAPPAVTGFQGPLGTVPPAGRR